MPLREDLLDPIPGDNPSGTDLYYDKVFDQIKEARIEDLDVGSAGAWERTAKKADHVLVIKLAGEALAKRSKDLRLAGWLIESHLKREGYAILPPSVDLLWKLQEGFWDTIYPMVEEDGNLDLRIGSIESTINRLAILVRSAPITRGGFSLLQYQESRRVGYEVDATTSDKQAARQDAVDHGQITADDFDISFAGTPKAFYTASEASLAAAAEILGQLGQFHEERYGDDYPSMTRLVTAVQETRQAVVALLNEKRKTEPDAVEEPVQAIAEEIVPEPEPIVALPAIAASEAPAATPPSPKAAVSKALAFGGAPATTEQARAAVLSGALFLQGEDAQSPVPYLVCAGLRLGETRQQRALPPPEFAVAPATETRQALRKLANEGSWNELMTLGLRFLTEPCGRAWLDLHRYLWRAATETGSSATAAAVAGVIAGLLKDLPELRYWTLDDDTPVANPETQQWLDAEVLPPPPVAVAEQAEPAPPSEPVRYDPPPPVPSATEHEEAPAPQIYDAAVELLQQGRVRDAVTLLARDAQLQPSGRSRFQRRVQVAQLCMTAERDAVAYPILMELSDEIERRNLDQWESAEMLAHPLSLLFRCLDRKESPAETREVLFDRICRLDPQAALAARE